MCMRVNTMSRRNGQEDLNGLPSVEEIRLRNSPAFDACYHVPGSLRLLHLRFPEGDHDRQEGCRLSRKRTSSFLSKIS